MRDRFIATTSRLLDEDPRLAVVPAEISRDGFERAERTHPDRVINAGLLEQLLIGAGAGISLTGMRPVMHTFASFLVERPFEQVKPDLGPQGRVASWSVRGLRTTGRLGASPICPR